MWYLLSHLIIEVGVTMLVYDNRKSINDAKLDDDNKCALIEALHNAEQNLIEKDYENNSWTSTHPYAACGTKLTK